MVNPLLALVIGIRPPGRPRAGVDQFVRAPGVRIAFLAPEWSNLALPAKA